MNEFKLMVHGYDFDVDAFLKTTSLTFDEIWRRGDPRTGPSDKYPTSGVTKYLGDGWKVSLHEQDQIAAAFLESNEEGLKHLAQFPGADTVILGLHYCSEIHPSAIGFCISASARLMSVSLRFGIELCFYVDLPKKDDFYQDE